MYVRNGFTIEIQQISVPFETSVLVSGLFDVVYHLTTD